MPDWGILTLPLIGATGVILLAFFTADDIAIDNMRVPPTLEWNGYSDVVVTQMLMDHLRDINQEAVEMELGIAVDSSRYDASLSEFEQYLGLTELVTGIRELMGVVPYYLNGEIAEDGDKLVLTLRIFIDDPDQAIHVVKAAGDLATIDTLLRDGALRILERIDPYIVAVYYHENELVAGEYKFERTREKLEQFVLTPPPSNNYLAYDLIGQMHLERAKCDTLLTENDRTAERQKAFEWLQIAHRQAPDFFLTNLHLAQLYIEEGRYDIADRFFAHAIGIEPNHWRPREIWGKALADQGRVRDAIYQYVAAVELNPASVPLRLALSNLYLKADYPEAAKTQFDKAVLIDPDAVYPDIAFTTEHRTQGHCRLH